MDSQSYRGLEVWQKAMDTVDSIYRITSGFPDEERFGLTSQMRRSAVSVPSNIAEGYGRSHHKEYLRYLTISRGSLMELETQLIVAVRQDLCNRQDAASCWTMMQETARLLHGLIRSVRSKPSD